jgi:hypothetical protein
MKDLNHEAHEGHEGDSITGAQNLRAFRDLRGSDFPSESLTARQWSTLLGITMRAFNLRQVAAAEQRIVRGGLTKFYRFDDLPENYRLYIIERKQQFRCLRIADLLDLQTKERWQPAKPLAALPPATQAKAHKVKSVLAVYFDALGAGMKETDANTKARSMWLHVFGETCNEKTIRRRAAKVEACGGPELARIEAYADGKSVPHSRAQLAVKLDVPDDFIAAFRAACLTSGMISAAFRKFDIAWKSGEAVPGFGTFFAAPRLRGGDASSPSSRASRDFPLTLEQCRAFAPSRAAMITASQGKFAAKVAGALPALETRSSQLRRCERYLFDDTRINIAALDEQTGNPITLKSYWCMEEASRQIVAFTVIKGRNASQADVDALTARALRTCGLAAPGAGYQTTLKYERGTTACSPAKQRLIEAMYPGQVVISRTDMMGGRNTPGDFAQDNSGNFFGKGKIESFMRTLAFFSRHIEGQRGGNYSMQPAALGIAGEDRDRGHLRLTSTRGTVADESVILAKAARALAIAENQGTDLSPDARMACRAFDIATPLHFESDVREAIALTIAYYNQYWTLHRMEGFLDIPEEKPNGGRRWRKESPNEKARRLERDLADLSRAPLRISPADACALMWKAQLVTVKPNGVRVSIDGRPFRFWKPDSIACYEAQRLTSLEKDYVAIFDRDWPQEIYLLQNSPAASLPKGSRRRGFELAPNEAAQFLECLPLSDAPQTNDPAAMARARGRLQEQHNRVAREVARGIEPILVERDEARATNLQKLVRIVTTTNGDQRAVQTSRLTSSINAERAEKPRRAAAQGPTAAEDFAAYLAQANAEEPNE